MLIHMVAVRVCSVAQTFTLTITWQHAARLMIVI